MAKRPTQKKSAGAAKRLIVNSTDKGGVGKSLFTVHLVEWVKDHPSQVPFAAFDPDHANKTLSTFQPDVTRFVDVYQSRSMDECLNALADVDISIVDGLGSQQKKTMMAWAKEVSLFEVCQEMGIALTFVNMIENDADVIAQTRSLIEDVGNKVDWLFVLNTKQTESFPLWDESKARAAGMSLGGVELEFTRIPAHLQQILSKGYLTLPAGAEHLSFNLLDQKRCRNLWASFSIEIEKAEHIILPTQPTQQDPAAHEAQN